MLLGDLLIPAVPGVQLMDVIPDEKHITLVMRMIHAKAECPLCHRASARFIVAT